MITSMREKPLKKPHPPTKARESDQILISKENLDCIEVVQLILRQMTTRTLFGLNHCYLYNLATMILEKNLLEDSKIVTFEDQLALRIRYLVL